MSPSSVCRTAAICGTAFAVIAGFCPAQQGPSALPNLTGFPDPAGTVRTFNQNGDLDLTGPFFQTLGTNDRSCATCHQPSDGMSVSAEHVQSRFDASGGQDPIFSPNDGSNCDHNIDLSTVDSRAAAYSLLRTRGLIRIALAVPINRDFEVVRVQNPYGCDDTEALSVYRRPLPATNLTFSSGVMWDLRESSPQTGTKPVTSSSYPQDRKSVV